MGYERAFGLRDSPFENVPDPRFFYATECHDEALAVLDYAMLRAKGPCVLVGPSGIGKSMLLERLYARLTTRTHLLTVRAIELGERSLISNLRDEFVQTRHGPGRSAAATPPIAELRAAVEDVVRRGDACLLVVDDAELLRRRHWTELLALAKLETAQRRLVQMAILGTPALIDRLDDSRMERFRRQIFRIVRLRPLTPAESALYISHRLNVAGGRADELLAPGCIDFIARLAGGIPAIINQLCDNALLDAFADGVPQVDAAHVRRVATDAMLLPQDKTATARSWIPQTSTKDRLAALDPAAYDPFESVRRTRTARRERMDAPSGIRSNAQDPPAEARKPITPSDPDARHDRRPAGNECCDAGGRARDEIDSLAATLIDANQAARALASFVAPTAPPSIES